ncbi:hypothetical protein [Natrialba taiwanensis]|uniref:Uncharacterized protein n=1 Tax=Natrialba taiwanensis DSM 12281 TaxID=1230458 RepID=M0A1Q0_9EURY|nr:hypothetical protein [Natrialba taiwanensis]ELY92256.1 hypothetical protein C484_09726 [Natrialba taiwanensis DSM 12281]
MNENKLGRRRFLRSTATVGIGVTGGIAANGTAAADNTDEIRVYADGNHWEYQIITRPAFDKLEKGSEADEEDSIIAGGDIADGQISDGVDSYWMDSDDSVTEIKVTYEDYGYIDIDIATPTDFYEAVALQRDENPDFPGYDYIIDIVDGDVKPHDRFFDHGQDSITGGTFKGTVDPGDTDAVLRTGKPVHVFIEDPDSPGFGFTVDLPE